MVASSHRWLSFALVTTPFPLSPTAQKAAVDAFVAPGGSIAELEVGQTR
jgi:hypothetical protein